MKSSSRIVCLKDTKYSVISIINARLQLLLLKPEEEAKNEVWQIKVEVNEINQKTFLVELKFEEGLKNLIRPFGTSLQGIHHSYDKQFDNFHLTLFKLEGSNDPWKVILSYSS